MFTNIRAFIFILCLSIVSIVSADHVKTGAAGAQSGDLYWVTFSGDCSCDGIYIMQIDSSGNITIKPKAIFSIGSMGSGASAIGKNGTNKLNLWHWKSSTFLSRTIVDKATLKATGTKVTSIFAIENDFLQVTQKPSNNFILVERDAGPLEKFSLATTGLPTGSGVQLDAAAPLENDEASVSADGLALITNRQDFDVNTPDRLFIQMLDDKGLPKGTPKELAKFANIEATDVTNAFPDGKRFVVYIVDSGTVPDDKLMLQVVNATGAKVGARVVINTPPNREEDRQVVAIDPQGKFVIFTASGEKHGCPNQDILLFQGLTSAGKKSGPEKVLVSCNYSHDDIQNLDILKE